MLFIRRISYKKKFYKIHSCSLYYKCFKIMNYYRNDSGQYYKSTITIIIYDPS